MSLRFRHGICVVIGVAIGTSIAQVPQGATNAPGGTAQFTVTATGTPTLSYQWYSNGASTTNGTLALTNVQQASPELERGRHLFEAHCAVCHGPHGEGGKGPTLAQPTLPRARDNDSLMRIISEGIGGTEMPRAVMPHEDINLVAAYVIFLGSQPVEVIPGDPARGEQIYEKSGCAQCHMLRGHGAVFGPDLSAVGLRRSAGYLRRALIDPNAGVPQSYSAWRYDVSLPENFLYVRLVTRDGAELSGVRVNEDTFSIQIREATGAVHSFFKSELTELHKDFGKSPMPSYANALKKGEMDDLVAYLASLRSEK